MICFGFLCFVVLPMVVVCGSVSFGSVGEGVLGWGFELVCGLGGGECFVYGGEVCLFDDFVDGVLVVVVGVAVCPSTCFV